ncbi:MAG: glycosyltransferase family 2 protein [Tissierellia bacterium]|nr:glycosyltransferase family 2 protein [Tissierellia bacterium]
MKISFVIPCYNEGANIDNLIVELKRVEGKLPSYDFEFLLVDDGSSDNTLELIKRAAQMERSVEYIGLSRNFGKEATMLAGFRHATGDYIGVMDADLQHPPEVIPQFVEALNSGYDMVATRRVDRKGASGRYNFGANIFYKLINFFGDDVKLDNGVQDFRLMRRSVVESILSLPESSRFSKGIFSWVGYKTHTIEVEDRPRVAGETKWSLFKSIRYGLDGLVSFSTVPLRISTFLGIIASAAGFIYAIYIVVKTLVSGIDAPGFATLACLILIMGGLNLLFLGVLGEYIGRIYKETKRRPLYLIRESSLKQK